MGQAREVMDRVTAAMLAKDRAGAAACYAEDAVAVTPDAGELHGRDAIAGYLLQFSESFSDISYEYIQKHDAGDVAIDEGYVFGINDGPLTFPDGRSIPATGRPMRVRSCDIATVQNGLVIVHHIYFDQLDFLGQLGLLPESDIFGATG